MNSNLIAIIELTFCLLGQSFNDTLTKASGPGQFIIGSERFKMYFKYDLVVIFIFVIWCEYSALFTSHVNSIPSDSQHSVSKLKKWEYSMLLVLEMIHC